MTEISKTYSLYIILIISIVTILLRVGPAWFFPPDKPTPPILVYLGRVMPVAVIAMLIVYCFRNIDLINYPHGLAEIIAGSVTAISFLIKRSTLISILLGTVTYMFLVQVVF